MFDRTFQVFRYLLRVHSPAHVDPRTIKSYRRYFKTFLGESILRGRVEMTHFEDLDILERSLKNPIKVPVHEVTGMKTAEDNYGAFISMTPGQPY